MNTATGTGRRLRICLWCLLAVAVEIGLYLSYRGHEAWFHYVTHLFVGAAAALLIITAVVWRRRRPVPYPLVWPVLGHVVAMFPDLLFSAGVAHCWWMDVLLGHISTRFVPGRNLTWTVVVLGALGLHLATVARVAERPRPA